jgi:hypothetical protein
VQPVPILIVEHDLDLVLALADRVFTDRLVAKLRYHPSRARVLLESPHHGDDPFDDGVGVVSGVAGQIRPYRLRRLGSPAAPR